MSDYTFFEVTDNHIKLLRRANVGYEDCEFGAPAIDCKRPYGNSSVYSDIADILGILPAEDEDGEHEFSDAQKDHMGKIHQETETVLQIILSTGEMKAGNYRSEKYTHNWERVL